MSSLFRLIIALLLGHIRRRAIDKLTTLLSAVAFCAVALVLSVVCLVFLSISAWHYMEISLSPHTAYLIIALFYLALLILVCLRRRKFLTNRISRFITHLLN
jgi:hypothetical protein